MMLLENKFCNKKAKVPFFSFVDWIFKDYYTSALFLECYFYIFFFLCIDVDS